jgi:hypothetical protein
MRGYPVCRIPTTTTYNKWFIMEMKSKFQSHKVQSVLISIFYHVK